MNDQLQIKTRPLPWLSLGVIISVLIIHIALFQLVTFIMEGAWLYQASFNIVVAIAIISVAMILTVVAMALLIRITIWRMLDQVMPIWVLCFVLEMLFVLLVRFPYSGLFLIVTGPLSFVIIMVSAFALTKINRMRILVLDGVNAGDVSAHGHIRMDYSDLVGQAISIDAVVATRQQMQDPSWQGFLTNIALHQIPVLTDNRYREITKGQVNLNDTDAVELIQLRPVRRYALLKRLMDVVLSLLALIMLSPLLLLVAILIRLESAGNPIFVQERVGLAGRSFLMLKFRSMVNEAEKSGAKFAAINDSRITRIGRIIRPSRIDELPQLINVLFGQMSLIGPRPEQQAMVDQLGAEIPLYHFRHAVRPGITGWAQVMQGYADDVKSTDTKLSFDLFYIKNLSLMMDIVIFFRTIRTILTGFGAR